MDNITLFSVITIMSFILLAPVAVFMEGVKFTPSYLQSAVSELVILTDSLLFGFYFPSDLLFLACQGLNIRDVYIRSFIAALCFHAYQQVRHFNVLLFML